MKLNEERWTVIGGLCALLALVTITNGCGKNQDANHLPRAAEAGCKKDDGCGTNKAVKPDASASEKGHEKHGDHDGHGHDKH